MFVLLDGRDSYIHTFQRNLSVLSFSSKKCKLSFFVQYILHQNAMDNREFECLTVLPTLAVTHAAQIRSLQRTLLKIELF